MPLSPPCAASVSVLLYSGETFTLEAQGPHQTNWVNLDARAYEEIAKVDVRGAWVTPGIFDMHSHLGVD